jgi:hypothetical protein
MDSLQIIGHANLDHRYELRLDVDGAYRWYAPDGGDIEVSGGSIEDAREQLWLWCGQPSDDGWWEPADTPERPVSTYEVWTIAPDCSERYVGLVDGANEDEAGARADELYSHGNPGGLELREQQRWYRTGFGGCCNACLEAGHVLDGHFACTAPSELQATDPGLASELRDGVWELLALFRPSVAAELGLEEVTTI